MLCHRCVGASMSHAWHVECDLRVRLTFASSLPAINRRRKIMDRRGARRPGTPCLHCMMVDLIENFFADYSATPGASDKVDTDEADEVIVAIAKTVAGLTSRQVGVIRQQLIEQLMREIMKYDDEFRREDAADESRISFTSLNACSLASAQAVCWTGRVLPFGARPGSCATP